MAKNDSGEKVLVKTDLPEVDQELSQVASNPKQNLLILVVISGVFLYLLFNLFLGGDESPKKEITPTPKEISKPNTSDVDSDIPSIPTLPSPPKLEDPTPPPVTEALPNPTAALPVAPVSPEAQLLPQQNEATQPVLPAQTGKNDEEQNRLQAKRKSSIVLVAGVQPQKTADELQEEADFKFRGDMNLVLGRGKVLSAIIETAVNSDLGGEIRAVITRDVYSEWGKNILLPKGSRVFGSYATGTSGAFGRIAIEWTRVDLANGYSLNLSGAGIDSLGRKGNQGRLDNKFKERFANAVLRSAFNITLANGLDSITKPQISSQAAANQNQVSTNIKNIATGLFTSTIVPNNPEADAAAKRVQICASVLAAIPDQTSTTFNQVNSACTSLNTDATSTNVAKLASLMNTINSSTDTLVQNTAANVEESKAQAASKQAFTDISDAVKTLVEEQEFKPTITIDQGTPVKIYVNKDYKFPAKAVKKSRWVK